MTTTIKITELTNIGANLNGTTLVPVVNMAGTPTTQRSNVDNLANYILNTGAGANLGAIGNITITGGNAGEVLSTDGNGVLSWESSGLTYSNANVAAYLPTYTGNITGDYITLTHDVEANVVYANYLYGDASNVTNLPVGTVAFLNTDGNASNVLHGDGTWGADTTTYSNSNVASYLPTYTGNVGANWVTANYIAGNATPLFDIAGANVTGTVGNANLSQNINVATVNDNFSYHIILSAGAGDKTLHVDADDNLQYNPADGTLTAVRVDATYFVGDLSYAHGLPVANVVGLGNISTINIDGNSANILYGNGVFDSIPNPFDQDLNTTDNVQFANVTSTEAIKFSNAGNIVGALGYAPTFVSIESYGSNAVQITANDFHTWSFGNTGVLSKSDANGLILAANYSTQIVTDYGDNNRTWLFDGTSGELVLPGGNVLIDPTDDNFEVRGAQAVNFEANTVVNIYTDTSNNAYQWQFGDDGILTVPSIAGENLFIQGAEIGSTNSGIGITANNNIVLTTDALGTPKFWTFDSNGDLTTTGNISAGNISATNAVVKSSGSWTVTPGAGTYSFTVDANESYIMWVRGNIPSGLITWNATVSVSNTNVPVLGNQYGWYYTTGNQLELTSLPSQIIGTGGSIITTDPSPTNSNVFTFGITNNSGSSQTVEYGWTKIS